MRHPIQRNSTSISIAAVLRALRVPVLAVAFAAPLLIGAAAQAQTKIAVIDLRRAVLETEEGLRVQATLKKLFDSRQLELDKKQQDLQVQKEDLDKQEKSGKLPKDEVARRNETLQKQFVEIQGLMVDYQREMQRKESELTTPIVQNILGIVRRIAAQDGFEMILEKAAVPYFRADLELTDRAIQMFNGGQPPSPAPAPAAPAGKQPAAPAPAKAPAPKKK